MSAPNSARGPRHIAEMIPIALAGLLARCWRKVPAGEDQDSLRLLAAEVRTEELRQLTRAQNPPPLDVTKSAAIQSAGDTLKAISRGDYVTAAGHAEALTDALRDVLRASKAEEVAV
jgi:hypothetical protein